MKTVSKKLFSLLLVAIMLVSAIPFQAFAEDTHNPGSSWEYNDSEHWQICQNEDCDAPDKKVNTSSHNFVNGVCQTCYKVCSHSWSDGVCSNCGVTCAHTWEGNTCTTCGKVCTHTWSGNTCTVCGMTCDHAATHTVTGTPATCTTAGTEDAVVCDVCGSTVSGGATINALTHNLKKVANEVPATCKDPGTTALYECQREGCDYSEGGSEIPRLTTHTYASNTATKCSVCEADRPRVTVTFKVEDPYTHDVNTYTTNKFLMDQTVTSAMLLDAVEDLNIPNAGQIRWLLNGRNFVGTKLTGDVEVVADIQTEKVYLHVWYKLGDTLTKFRDIELDKALYKNTPALNYLIRNVDDDFKALVDTKLGYEWKNEKWYDYYYQDTSLTDQSHLLNSDRSVVAKLTPVSTYKITFEVGTPGGEKATLTKSDSVKNMSGNVMTVTYNKSIGTLPKAKCDGWVFKGWYTEEDGQGTKYENDRTYTVAGDTILYAYWEEQVTVIVRTYVNSNTSTPVKLAMDGYSEGDAITYDQVKERVKQNYKGFDMDGLFDKNSWQQYKDSNSTKKGAQALTVTAGNDGTYSVYVRLHNASTNNSTPDRSNPKTGDSAMIYTAAAVLVLAGCGLAAAAYVTRKKKA